MIEIKIEFGDVIELGISEEGRLELGIFNEKTALSTWLTKSQLIKLIAELGLMISKVSID